MVFHMITDEPRVERGAKHEAELNQIADYFEAVKTFFQKIGVQVKREFNPGSNKNVAYIFTQGTESVLNEDSEKEIQIPIKVGDFYEEYLEMGVESTSEELVRDELKGIHHERTKFVFPKKVFRFTSALQPYFSKLLSLVPGSEVFRVFSKDGGVEIEMYTDLTPEEKIQLKRQITPDDDGLVRFLQGEWVFVDAADPNHKIASFGKGRDACRYWLVYDPVSHRAAATHLDLVDDVPVVIEMTGHLLRAGSKKENLLLFGSENANLFAQRTLRSMYPQVRFDLNNDFVFDVQTGKQEHLNQDLQKRFGSDDEESTRIMENTEIRLAHNISHVLVYKSPTTS